MVVATRAPDGQTHETARNNINPVVDNVRLIVEKAPAQSQKTHGCERAFVAAEWQLVGRNLFEDKSVKRQVFIESTNYIIAIGISVRISPLFLEHITLRVRVTSDIQPMPPPTFSIARRSEQSIDNCSERVG